MTKTIGAGWLLTTLDRPLLIHVTDGSRAICPMLGRRGSRTAGTMPLRGESSCTMRYAQEGSV